MKNFKTKLSIIAIAVFFLALMTTERANAQFGLSNPIFDVQYNNQFDDASDWMNVGIQSFVVGDTASPVGFYSSQMGAINSFTQDNGFALFDSDAIGGMGQYAELQLLDVITPEGHDNYGIAFQSYHLKYNDSVYVKISKGGVDTLIELHAGQLLNELQDSTHYVDLSNFVSTGEDFTISFVYIGEWDYAWMLDDLVVLAWNPTQTTTAINNVYNGTKELSTIYNMLGQPVTTMVKGQAYIKVYTDGTREKVAIR